MTMRSARPVEGSIGEHDAGARRAHLALDDDGDVHVGLREAALGAVEDGARAEQRGPAAPDGVHDGVGAADVEEGLVHARERRGLGVLRGGRGAHRDGLVDVAAGQGTVGRDDRRPPASRASAWSATSSRAAARGGLERERCRRRRRRRSCSASRARRPLSSQNAAYAGAATTKPAGTGGPPGSARPGWRPCPPANATSSRERSAKGRTACSRARAAVVLMRAPREARSSGSLGGGGRG